MLVLNTAGTAGVLAKSDWTKSDISPDTSSHRKQEQVQEMPTSFPKFSEDMGSSWLPVTSFNIQWVPFPLNENSLLVFDSDRQHRAARNAIWGHSPGSRHRDRNYGAADCYFLSKPDIPQRNPALTHIWTVRRHAFSIWLAQARVRVTPLLASPHHLGIPLCVE
jgi:hypothetical protein